MMGRTPVPASFRSYKAGAFVVVLHAVHHKLLTSSRVGHPTPPRAPVTSPSMRPGCLQRPSRSPRSDSHRSWEILAVASLDSCRLRIAAWLLRTIVGSRLAPRGRFLVAERGRCRCAEEAAAGAALRTSKRCVLPWLWICVCELERLNVVVSESYMAHADRYDYASLSAGSETTMPKPISKILNARNSPIAKSRLTTNE
jgi:hypothetical protein